MADNSAIQYILNQAAEKAQKSQPDTINHFDANRTAVISSFSSFFRELSEYSVKNGVVDEKASPSDDKAVTARASAFALRAINNIDAAEKMKENIRDFFDDEKNAAWFKEQNIGHGEKDMLREELQIMVDEKMDIKPKTKAGKQFYDDLKAVYKETRDDIQVGDNKFIEQGLKFIYYTNQNMGSANMSRDAVDYARNTIAKTLSNTQLLETLYDNLYSNSSELAGEVELSAENVQQFSVLYGSGIDVKPSEFLERSGKGKLTYEDRVWAKDSIDNLYSSITHSERNAGNEGYTVSPGDFQLNGEPMFSEKELSDRSPLELSTAILENVLKGEDVTVNGSGMRAPVRVDPKFVEKENGEKNIWQKIYEFFVNLFGTSENQKVADIENNIAAKSEENKVKREKISFAELAGINSYSKVTAPPSKQKQNELTASKKTPEMKGRF